MTGRKLIPDKLSCEAAATSLGLGVVAVEEKRSSNPPGCFWRDDNSKLFYNRLTTSTYQSQGIQYTASCSTMSGYCLCLSAPNCLVTDGTTSNAGPCICGNTGCTIASGLHCYASDNFCAAGPPCTTTDGSIANTKPCGCGNVGCTAATGLICYSTIGSGSCRKVNVGGYGYPKSTNGNCMDVNGRGMIGDKASCEAAAVSLGLGNDTAILHWCSKLQRSIHS